MMNSMFALIVQQIAETQRYFHKNNKYQSSSHAWQAIYLINKLEFDLYPELKKQLIPVRLSIEKIEKRVDDEDWSDFAKSVDEAFSEISIFLSTAKTDKFLLVSEKEFSHWYPT
jgi:hypothetical protein